MRRAAFLLALCFGCARLHRGSTAPHIDAVQPDSLILAPGAVVEVVVRGSGFAPGTPGRNTIQFGEVTITDVPASADGKQIRMVIPQTVPSGGEAAPLPLEAGRYAVRVKTSAGTSNAISVRVDR